MDDLEEKLENILGDPQMMQQIMSMAQAMGSQGGNRSDVGQRQNDAFPEIDIATLQKISGLAQKSSIDQREQALLRALGAYLSKDRIGKHQQHQMDAHTVNGGNQESKCRDDKANAGNQESLMSFLLLFCL